MKIRAWARRGTSTYAPENTLEAFSLVAEQGVDGVELNVQPTRDHQLIVTRDETTDRVSNRFGYIKGHTLSQLKELHFSKLFPEYRQASVPALREVCELLRPIGLVISVELKTGIIRYEGIEEEVLLLAAEMGMKDRVVYSSFYHPSLARLRGLDPLVYTGLLYSDGRLDMASYGRNRIHINVLHPTLYYIRDKDLVPVAMTWELKLHVWTVNEEPHMEVLVKQDVEAITANKPDLCRSAVNRMG